MSLDIILLRGLVREAGHWGRFVDDLRAAVPHARVHLPDLPGNGTRWREPSPLSIADMVAAARTATAVEKPLLVAVSLGGMVALEWARRHEVRGLVLVNSSLANLNPPWQRLRATVWPSIVRALSARDIEARERLILGIVSNRTEGHGDEGARWTAIARQHPVSRQNALRQIVAAARYRAAEAPRVPALVLVGDGDRLVAPACSRALAAHLRAPLEVHPTAGHDLTFDDGPWVAAAVQRFAAQLPA